MKRSEFGVTCIALGLVLHGISWLDDYYYFEAYKLCESGSLYQYHKDLIDYGVYHYSRAEEILGECLNSKGFDYDITRGNPN